MKKFVVCAVMLAAVASGGIAYSAVTPSAKLGKEDRVWGGGNIPANACSVNEPSYCLGRGRNVAVDAHANSDGSDAVGNSAWAGMTMRTVTCESVAGNKAAVGGVIVASEDPAQVGWGYVQYYVDRGTTSLATPQHDYVSFSQIDPLDAPSWPKGFPYVCPPAGGTPTLEAIYFEMIGGDLTVQDASANK